MDERDLEIARLRGEVAGLRAKRSGGGGFLKFLGWLALIVGGLFLAFLAYGLTLPKGSRYEAACKATVQHAAVRRCMEEVEWTYRGPDRESNKRNAAAQWARDNGLERDR